MTTTAPTITALTATPVTVATEREAMSFLFVVLETSDGDVAFGEACDSFGCSYASVLATLIDDVYAPIVVGQSIESPSALSDRLLGFTRRRLGDGWIAAQARSAVELAAWDALGRTQGASVSRLLGRHRDEVEVYASCGFLEEGSAAQHLDTMRPLLDRGVRRVKVRVGPEWQRDLDTLQELRGMLGHDIELMVDGSEGFTLPTAQLMATRLAQLGVTWLEEPLPQRARDGIRRLAAASAVPIAYGEHLFGRAEALEAMQGDGVQVLQPDPATCGGLAEARAIADLAAQFGVRVVPHMCAGPVALAATLHLAASVPAIRLIEYPPTLAPVWQRFGGAALCPDAIVDGRLPVPDAPGLGVDVDLVATAQHPYRAPSARVAGTVSGLPDRFNGDR